MKPPSLLHCLEIAARGVSFTRCFARPCLATAIKDVWWVHDDHSFGEQQRNDEWFALADIDPETLDRWARGRATKRFIINVVAKNSPEKTVLLNAFKQLGYRLWRTEPFMLRPTAEQPRLDLTADIRSVESESMAAQLTKAAGERLILPEHLSAKPARVRCQVAMIANAYVGWVRSLSIDDASWCASLFVQPEFRRRGIGRSLMVALLRADHKAGSSASLLLSRHQAAPLYTDIGYQTIGTLLVFSPPRT